MTLYEPHKACVTPCKVCVCSIQAIIDRGHTVENSYGQILDSKIWKETGQKVWAMGEKKVEPKAGSVVP